MPVAPIRIFKAVFGLSVAALFVWFCVFWNETFATVEVTLASPTTASTPCDGITCVEPAIALPQTTEDVVGPPAPRKRLPVDLTTQATYRMFQARFHGPYALSIRDGLNEMVIGSSLLAQGVVAGDGTAASGLGQILGAIPAQLPTYGYISSGYGTRRSPFTGRTVHHKGVDFAVQWGSPVYATADGVVTFSGWHRGLGKMIAIDHGYGIVTKYGHNSSLTVRAGDGVKRGDVIARAGSTGRSTGSHVHYEVWVNDRTIDPSEFMFDVPDRSREDPVAAVAWEQNPPRAHHLGLAVGGDGVETLRDAPPPYDKQGLWPLNFAIVGLFVFVVTILALTLWPRRVVLGRDSI